MLFLRQKNSEKHTHARTHTHTHTPKRVKRHGRAAKYVETAHKPCASTHTSVRLLLSASARHLRSSIAHSCSSSAWAMDAHNPNTKQRGGNKRVYDRVKLRGNGRGRCNAHTTESPKEQHLHVLDALHRWLIVCIERNCHLRKNTQPTIISTLKPLNSATHKIGSDLA